MTTAVEAQPKVSRSARYRRVMESLMIRDEHGMIVPLHFSDSQEILWSQVAPRLERKEKIWDICLKPRQVYASTFYCGLGFVRTLEAPLTHSLVIAQDLDTSSELFDKVKFFYEHFPLPKVGKPTVKTLNVPLPGGISRYRVISAGIAAKGRGTTQSVMHCSEVAFWQHPEILTGILQVMPDLPNTILVLESTANGMRGTGEMFYEEWMRAVSGESGLNPIFIPWWIMPKYRKTPGIVADDWDEDERLLHGLCGVDGEQLAWRRWAINTKLQGSADLFNQEYPSCVVGNTRVSTEWGILRIDELRGQTVEGGGRIVKWGPQLPSDISRVTTEAGRVLEGTVDHPVRLETGEFRGLGALRPGDRIRLRPPRFADQLCVLEFFGVLGHVTTLEISPDLARFLGYFLGDGCYSGGAVSVVCAGRDLDVVADVNALFSDLFGSAHTKAVGSKGGGIEVRVGSVAFAGWMKRLGIWQEEKPHRKVRVPECIFRSPRAVVREFLRGLFEADGFNGYKVNRVVLFNKSVEFLRDIQLLLLGFGITSRVKSRPAVNGAGYHYSANTLELRSREAIRFNAEIGFVGEHKRNRAGSARRGIGRPAKPMELTDTVATVLMVGHDLTWDLTVEPDHVFSANGIETHNTPEMAFIFSGQPAFDHRAIYRQREHVRPPLARGTLTGPERKDWTDDPKGDLRIWKWPEAGHQYVIGADTSEGIEGGDYACAEVLNMQNLEQVAVLHGLIPTWDFATLVNSLGRFYHNAVLAVEVNNTGHAVQDHLIHHYYYPRLHRWRGKPDRIKWGDAKLFGWETNTYSRPLLIEAGRRAVNTNLVTLREEKLLDELKHFSKNDFGKYEAEAGHDDRVLALLIALRSREENYFPARVASESISDHALVGLPTGVHVVDQDEPTYAGRKKIGQILRDRAKQAVKGWMEYLWVIGLLYGTPTIV